MIYYFFKKKKLCLFRSLKSQSLTFLFGRNRQRNWQSMQQKNNNKIKNMASFPFFFCVFFLFVPARGNWTCAVSTTPKLHPQCPIVMYNAANRWNHNRTAAIPHEAMFDLVEEKWKETQSFFESKRIQLSEDCASLLHSLIWWRLYLMLYTFFLMMTIKDFCCCYQTRPFYRNFFSLYFSNVFEQNCLYSLV